MKWCAVRSWWLSQVREVSQVVSKPIHNSQSGNPAISLNGSREQLLVTARFQKAFLFVLWRMVCWKGSWSCWLVDPDTCVNRWWWMVVALPTVTLLVVHEWKMGFGVKLSWTKSLQSSAHFTVSWSTLVSPQSTGEFLPMHQLWHLE